MKRILCLGLLLSFMPVALPADKGTLATAGGVITAAGAALFGAFRLHCSGYIPGTARRAKRVDERDRLAANEARVETCERYATVQRDGATKRKLEIGDLIVQRDAATADGDSGMARALENEICFSIDSARRRLHQVRILDAAASQARCEPVAAEEEGEESALPFDARREVDLLASTGYLSDDEEGYGDMVTVYNPRQDYLEGRNSLVRLVNASPPPVRRSPSPALEHVSQGPSGPPPSASPVPSPLPLSAGGVNSSGQRDEEG